MMDILTACLAVYGALLSSYLAWVQLHEKRPKIKVSVQQDIVLLSADITSDPLMVSSASNLGHVVVTISTNGFAYVGKKGGLVNPWPEFGEKLPQELPPGQRLDILSDPKLVADALKKAGFSGEMKLRPYFTDAVGHTYNGAPIIFNIDVAAARNIVQIRPVKQR